MATHASARKRARRNATKAKTNKSRVSRVRTLVKKVEQAIASGDAKKAAEAMKKAKPELQRGVTKGTLQKNAVARKISRLTAKIKALQ